MQDHSLAEGSFRNRVLKGPKLVQSEDQPTLDRAQPSQRQGLQVELGPRQAG